MARVKIFYPLPPLLDWALQWAGPWVGTQAVEWWPWVGTQAVEWWVVPSHEFVGQCTVSTGIQSERKGKGTVPSGQETVGGLLGTLAMWSLSAKFQLQVITTQVHEPPATGGPVEEQGPELFSGFAWPPVQPSKWSFFRGFSMKRWTEAAC